MLKEDKSASVIKQAPLYGRKLSLDSKGHTESFLVVPNAVYKKPMTSNKTIRHRPNVTINVVEPIYHK